MSKYNEIYMFSVKHCFFSFFADFVPYKICGTMFLRKSENQKVRCQQLL